VGAPPERLARKACAGTRPNENNFMVLVLGPLRKALAIRLLHRRTWLRGKRVAQGCSEDSDPVRPAFVMPPRRLRAPTLGPASRSRQPVRDPGSGLRTNGRPPPTRRFRGPGPTDTPGVKGWADPGAPPWFRDPAEPAPAHRPSASPAWHQSEIEGRAKTDPILHVSPKVAATRQSARGPEPLAPDRWSSPGPRR